MIDPSPPPPIDKPLGYRRKSPPPRDLAPTDVQETLERLLPAATIQQIAKETGFVVRERDIHPVTFLWSLVLGFGVELYRFLEQLRAAYVQASDLKDIAYSSYHARFDSKLSKFLQRCLQVALANLPQEPGRDLDPRLKAIADDVVIKDSSVVRLHASLATHFPATRSRTVAAGVKVDTLVSVCANGPKSVALVGERTADIKTLRLGPWITGRILLADLGYFSYRLFAKIDEYQGFFVSRCKENADPQFVRSLKVHRGQAIGLEGRRLSEVLPRLQRGVLDAEVEVALKRRIYNGRRSSDTFRCRLVAIWNVQTRRYHVYLTNISPEQLGAEEVAQLYSLRWDIELTFKELKSSYALDKFKTKSVDVVEALIWTALLTLVASRRVHNLVRAKALAEHRARYTQLRWGKAFRRAANDVLACLLAHLGLETDAGDPHAAFRRMNRALTRFALDPHVNRQRFREEWST